MKDGGPAPDASGRSVGSRHGVPGISGAGRGLEAERSTSSSHGDPSGCASQATWSITGGAVTTWFGSRNALPLRSWITWQARSSSGKCADEGNASLRVFKSAGAGLRPSVQAARTRKAVSTSSLGLMVVSDLHLILGLNVCFCTGANSPMVPIHLVRVVDAWHEHRATRRTAQSCRRRPGGGHAVAGEAGHGSDHREGRH